MIMEKETKTKLTQTCMYTWTLSCMYTQCIEWQQYIKYNNIQGTVFLLKFYTKWIGSKIYARFNFFFFFYFFFGGGGISTGVIFKEQYFF